jgi:outer membrane protein assembly factor BamA
MDMKGTNSIVFGVAACILLVGSIMLGRQQHGELSGIRGLPVEGHDIVAGVEIVGTKHLREPYFQKLRERFRSNGADLRLGLPLETQTLCRFKEVLRDVMREKGFLDAEVTHDTQPTYGNPRHLTLKFRIIEGKRSRPIARAAPLPSPAQRCSR